MVSSQHAVTPRFEWMDVLRGCAALLVLHHHADVILRLKYRDLSEVIAWSTTAMEPFRMPLLMLLSGLLVHRALQKGMARYVRGKLDNIAWPYLVWTGILIALFGLRLVVLGKPMPFDLAEAVLLGDAMHMWFLYYLFFFYLLHVPLAAVPSWAVLACAMLGVVLADGTFASKFGYMFAFFSLGVVLGRNLGAVTAAPMWSSQSAIWAWPLFAVLAVLAWQLTALLPEAAAGRRPLYTLAGLLPIIWMAMRATHGPLGAALRYLGRNAIVIYLAHVPIAMVLPLTFASISTGNIDLLYPAYVLAILGLCVLLVELRRARPSVGLLFAPPAAIAAGPDRGVAQARL